MSGLQVALCSAVLLLAGSPIATGSEASAAADVPWFQQAEARAKAALPAAHGPDLPARHIELSAYARMREDCAEAKDHAEQACELVAQSLRDVEGDIRAPVSDLVRARYALGCALRACERYAEARVSFGQAVELARRLLPEHDPHRARSEGAYASMQAVRGDLEQARTICFWAVNHVQEHCGDEDLEIAWIDDVLAGMYLTAGHTARALPVLEHALAIRRAAMHDAHPDLAVALNKVASVAFTLGDHARAATLLEEALAVRRRAFGPDHPLTRRSMDNLQRVRQPQSSADGPDSTDL